jgi:hypothetical protein
LRKQYQCSDATKSVTGATGKHQEGYTELHKDRTELHRETHYSIDKRFEYRNNLMELHFNEIGFLLRTLKMHLRKFKLLVRAIQKQWKNQLAYKTRL